MELANQLSTAPFWVILGALLLYLSRQMFEGRLKSEFARTEKLIDSSLGLKTGLRGEEQAALVEFRMKIEEWEYFLQIGVGDLVMKSELADFEPADFHKNDTKLFGEVRKAAVKAAVLLRNTDLEIELLETINKIRAIYYPMIQKTIGETLHIQRQIAPYAQRMKLFDESGMKDLSVAHTPADAQALSALRHQMSAALATYCTELVAEYPAIAEQLWELKHKINAHIYRPLTSHKIDEPAQ